MRIQIYFRMHKVRATRDITSLSHRETKDLPDHQIRCNNRGCTFAIC